MAVGWTGTAADLNALACEIASNFTEGAAMALQLQTWLESAGATALASAGMSTADATAFQTQASYLNNIALLLGGELPQAQAFNFLSAISSMVGPGSTATTTQPG
jgi:hypothetical protein